MRLLALLVAVLVAPACAKKDQNGLNVPVSGTIIGKPFPKDRRVQAHFIALDTPVFVAGTFYGEVKIDTYDDAILFFVAENVSHRAKATCHLSHGSSWGRDSVLCTSKDIGVEP